MVSRVARAPFIIIENTSSSAYLAADADKHPTASLIVFINFSPRFDIESILDSGGYASQRVGRIEGSKTTRLTWLDWPGERRGEARGGKCLGTTFITRKDPGRANIVIVMDDPLMMLLFR